jgi:hypothetical protein
MSKRGGCKKCSMEKMGVKTSSVMKHTCNNLKLPEEVCEHITFMDKDKESTCFLCGEPLPAGFKNPIP